MDDHPEDYRSLNYENWCELLSPIEVKDESKREALQIKRIASARAASLSESNKSMKILRKKKDKTGVSRSNKSPKRVHNRHHGIQRYCVICKKVGNA